jgi:hypothetical protein
LPSSPASRFRFPSEVDESERERSGGISFGVVAAMIAAWGGLYLCRRRLWSTSTRKFVKVEWLQMPRCTIIKLAFSTFALFIFSPTLTNSLPTTTIDQYQRNTPPPSNKLLVEAGEGRQRRCLVAVRIGESCKGV